MMFLIFLPALVFLGCILGINLKKLAKEISQHLQGTAEYPEVSYPVLALQLLVLQVTGIVFLAAWLTVGFLLWRAFQ